MASFFHYERAEERYAFLRSEGEMSQYIAAFDWSAHPLGPLQTWPQSLRTAVSLILNSQHPMWIGWGRHMWFLYNDAYLHVLGLAKHPWALGRPASEVWSEIWDFCGPLADKVFEKGEASFVDDVRLFMSRGDLLEETFYSFSYSPIRDESEGVGGLFCPSNDVTAKVVGARRLQTLSELGASALVQRTTTAACASAAATLAKNGDDVPLALLYLSEDGRPVLQQSVGPERAGRAFEDAARSVLETGRAERLSLRDEPSLVTGAAGLPVVEAIVLPMAGRADSRPLGVLVAGINPTAKPDSEYATFFELVASNIGTAIANTRVAEEEKRRADMLAEMDRAKTVFFSNISHEFRTPLTLMLGPLEQLSRMDDQANRQLAQTARRNSLRLLKLVNTLLEFSRLEAGRSDAAFTATDLAALTRDVASSFRSAIENAGLRFTVDAALDEPVFVDRSMWERILLNLLSNALKFTFEGEISVRLRAHGTFAELSVQDTGVGIAPENVGELFERFNRVRGSKSRSHEGSGIGLALVQDLTAIHHGVVDVQSVPGEGSTFNVRIPLGTAHLDPAHIVKEDAASYSSAVEQYLAEVDTTMAGAASTADSAARDSSTGRARILLADDNPDLREYVTNILSGRYDVTAVSNGREALAALQSDTFRLIVSDVMMPEMDGFALLRAVRTDERLAPTPFILLSARAGEESSLEGLLSGADDYIVKPFSSEELFARVYAQLHAASIREEALEELRVREERFRTLASSLPYIVFEADASGSITFLSDEYTSLTGLPVDAREVTLLEAVHPDDQAEARRAWNHAIETGEALSSEFRLRRRDGLYRWCTARALAQFDTTGSVMRWTGTITDVHDQRQAARERDFLAGASEILAQSLDLQGTLEAIASFSVTSIADVAQVDLLNDEGRIATAAYAHRDPEKDRSESLGSADVVSVPLAAEKQTLGFLRIRYSESSKRYHADDASMLAEFGRRAGLAIQNARLFEREHRAAESFQEASLPAMLPQVPGLRLDAFYAPGRAEAQVGGDWYDAVRLIDGRIVLSIGDVAGSGLQAAVTMGNMRQIIRGIAQVYADPALMLDAADRALRLEYPEKFVTAFVCVYDPITSVLRYASAGHPPALLRRANGEIEALSHVGLPLGLRAHGENAISAGIELEPGSMLVLYTDGLTEVDRTPEQGERQLRSLLAEPQVHASDHPAKMIVERTVMRATASDDVAVLVLTLAEASQDEAEQTLLQRWTVDTGERDTVGDARMAFAASFATHGGCPDDVAMAELVFGELISNAVRYAPGVVDVIVDWSGPEPVLHVIDNGPGFRHIAVLPPDLYSESGRGLFIVSALTADFRVSKRERGGSHARAVLRLQRRQLVDSHVHGFSNVLLHELSDQGGIVSS